MGLRCELRNRCSLGDGQDATYRRQSLRTRSSSCLHAVEVARDVSIDEAQLLDFAANLNAGEVRSVAKGHLGENLDTLSNQFEDARNAVNFAVLFSLLQFGHGFRREL